MRGATARGPGGTVRRLATLWMRGWVAGVAAIGEPYLSLSGRMEGPRVNGSGKSTSQGGVVEPEAEAWRRSA